MSFEVAIHKNKKDYTEFTLDCTVFNGGEINLRLPKEGLAGPWSVGAEGVSIVARSLDSSDGIMSLLMLVDALRREHPIASFRLFLGYTPYARQDRVCNKGEALSIKVFGDLINSMNFSEVMVVDPHSDVVGACINNCKVYSQAEIISDFTLLTREVAWVDTLLVSPDAGAIKKSEEVSRVLGADLVQGVKKRDTSTGVLSGFGVVDPNGLVAGRHCLIVDDICDGGGTFLGLAKVLKEQGAGSVSLYVTHGIFSNGIAHLLDNGIDHVYTTDTFNSGEEHDRLTILDI